MSRGTFLARYPWPWLVVPEPSFDILSRIQRPETVIAQAQTQNVELPNSPKLRGASLDALCLELRPKSDRDLLTAVIQIGRSPEADVVLLDDSVSRLHAELRCDRRSGIVTLTDLEAKNGTWVGSQQLEAMAPVEVSSGSVVRTGALLMRYHDAPGFLDWLEEGAPRSGASPGKWPTQEP
ncbi:MAG: FHA domain-containing protein [Myxococcota bacterium]